MKFKQSMKLQQYHLIHKAYAPNMSHVISLQSLQLYSNSVITYIVARLPYSIFQTQYVFQPDLLHVRCWDEQFWLIIIILVDYCTLPCQGWVSGHSDLRTDVAIYVISERLLMPIFISVLSHWTDGVSDGLYCMVMTQHFILCYGYYCFYTDFCDMY